jgi:outer membrane immunogenic protein
MRRVLLAGASALSLAAFAQSASAADLPARTAYPAKAPAYIASVYNWTGFYVGGHVGWGRVDLTSTVVAPPGFGSVGDDQSGFLGGGQVGFNYQVGAWVFGVEGDIAWTDIGRTTTTTFGGVTIADSNSVDWIATVTGRVGYAFGPAGNALLYVKGGVAWLDWSARSTVTGFGPAFAVTGGNTETGWTVGAGFEYGFTPNWSAKIEYNYLDFGTERTAGGGVVIDTDLTTHIVKAGINYRFGTW